MFVVSEKQCSFLCESFPYFSVLLTLAPAVL
nr:MAG TPA: hypothetical protein [Caudoviricetes sp.]